MPTRQSRHARASYQADQLAHKLAGELRDARLAAGLSLRDVAAATGVSASHLHRIEHARVPAVPLRTLAVAFVIVGMRLSARPYPDGTAVRDEAQARLMARFRVVLPAVVRFRTEVPLQLPGDLRAWDGELEAPNGSCKLEAETVLYDLQAQERRIAVKMADDGVGRVILLVADTRHNREVLRAHRDALAARFPLDTRAVLRELRVGRIPAASGIVVR